MSASVSARHLSRLTLYGRRDTPCFGKFFKRRHAVLFQHVLVLGAGGGVGSFAVQLAHEFGATVTGVCSTSKVDLVRSLGADHVVDYTRSDFTGPYDLIVGIAGQRPLSRLRRALTPRGTLIIVGGEGGGRWFGGIDRVLRAMLWSVFVSQRLRGFFSRENAADFAVLASLAAEGKLTPVIDRTYSLGEVPEAIRYVAQGHTRGKVVITV